jgi:hypothetical protein
MMLGALNPMGAVPVSFGQPQTFSQGQTQSTITIPASQRQYYQTPQPVNTSPVDVEQPSSPNPDVFAPTQQTDYLAMAKKYAPYVIGAVVLYYLILKNK